MSDYAIAICRKCGDSGYTIDEFTSPYTGLCAKCSDPAKEEEALVRIVGMILFANSDGTLEEFDTPENATREGAD